MLTGDFVQGVYVTILGMGLVFSALGVLMLIIMGLQWALRGRQAPAVETLGFSTVAAESVEEEDLGAATAAAIGTAMAIWKQRREQAQLPPPRTTVVTFAPGSEAWRALGRLS